MPPTNLSPNRPLYRALVLNASVPLMLMLALGAALTWQYFQVRQGVAWVSSSLQEQNQAVETLTQIELAEDEHRGYMLTQDPALRTSYRRGLRELKQDLDGLAHFARGDTFQTSLVARIRLVEQQREQRQAAAMAATRHGLSAESLRRFRKDLKAGDITQLRGMLDTYRDSEETWLRSREEGLRQASRGIILLGAGGLLLGMAFFVFFARRQYALLSRSFNRTLEQVEAQKTQIDGLYRELRDYSGELETRVAERTRENRQKAQMLDMVQEGIYVTSLDDNRILFWSEGAAAMYGYSSSEALGQDCSALLEGQLPSPLEVKRQLHEHGSWSGEFVHTCKDRRTLVVAARKAVQHDEHGEPLAVLNVNSDVTSYKQALEAAEEASQAKSMFLANMSHELRTPLNAIIGYSELLMEELAGDAEATLRSDLTKIHGAGRHLLGLINDILDLTKIEAGKLELYLETFDLTGLLNEVAQTIAPLIAQKGNQLELLLEATLPAMYSDVTKLRQTLFNLLSNAAKFTENGRITLEAGIRVIDAADWLQVCIRDTGIGMSAEQLAGLFQEFRQADASTTRKYGGTGLGLALSRRFSEMLGGEIQVESTEGQGSSFTLLLPLRLEATAEVAQEPVLATAPANEVRHSVLVIDDDATARELLLRHMRHEGFRVYSAASGPEGLALAVELKPDIITLDLMMAGMDGWSVLGAIKADPRLSGIPLVIVSMLDDRTLGFALGIDDFLMKPVDRRLLGASLRRLVAAGRQEPVLIVDDDPVCRELVARQLEGEGFALLEARNGREAIEMLQGVRPALILLDIMMPEIDGFELIAALREREEWRDIPVIAITAAEMSPTERHYLVQATESIMRKGHYNQDDLLGHVRRLLQARTEESNAHG